MDEATTETSATSAVCIPPMRAMFDIPLKTDPNTKFKVEWELAMPYVTFLYNEEKDGEVVAFTSQLESNCLFEKFGIKKGNDEGENANNLGDTLTQYFTDNLVTLEVWEEKYYAMEFRTKDNETLFTAYLKND